MCRHTQQRPFCLGLYSPWEVETSWRQLLEDMQPVVVREDHSILSVLVNCGH